MRSSCMSLPSSVRAGVQAARRARKESEFGPAHMSTTHMQKDCDTGPAPQALIIGDEPTTLWPAPHPTPRPAPPSHVSPLLRLPLLHPHPHLASEHALHGDVDGAVHEPGLVQQRPQLSPRLRIHIICIQCGRQAAPGSASSTCRCTPCALTNSFREEPLASSPSLAPPAPRLPPPLAAHGRRPQSPPTSTAAAHPPPHAVLRAAV